MFFKNWVHKKNIYKLPSLLSSLKMNLGTCTYNVIVLYVIVLKNLVKVGGF